MSNESVLVTDPDQAQELEGLREYLEKYPNLPGEVAIVIPSRPANGVSTEIAESVAKWVLLGFRISFLKDSLGGFIEVMRQRMAHDFMKRSPAKYLLMIDDDVVPKVALPFLLARHDQPVVGGPTPILLGKEGVCMNFTVRDEHGVPRFPSLMKHKTIPSHGLLEVPHVGTGAMCIRRDVLESFAWQGDDVPFYIPSKYREDGAKTGSLRRGEDIQFCSQVRAKGFKVYVDLEARCGHRKSFVVGWPEECLDAGYPLDKFVSQPGEMVITE